jgi:hypothetical protein
VSRDAFGLKDKINFYHSAKAYPASGHRRIETFQCPGPAAFPPAHHEDIFQGAGFMTVGHPSLLPGWPAKQYMEIQARAIEQVEHIQKGLLLAKCCCILPHLTTNNFITRQNRVSITTFGDK